MFPSLSKSLRVLFHFVTLFNFQGPSQPSNRLPVWVYGLSPCPFRLGRFVRCSNIIPNPTPFVNTFFEIFSAFFKKTFFYPFSLVKRGDSAAFPFYYIWIEKARGKHPGHQVMCAALHSSNASARRRGIPLFSRFPGRWAGERARPSYKNFLFSLKILLSYGI